MASCLSRSYCRLFSTAPSISSDAWQLLHEKMKTCRPTSAQLKVIEKERPFALAPEVVCHTKGFVNGEKTRQHIYLEWLEDANLNVGIEVTARSTYTVDVKAVFYALVWAHFLHKNPYVRVYSRNEIVTKCATGKFNAKASADLFGKIKAKLNSDNSILRARVAYFAPNLAIERGITKPETRPEVFTMMTETQFLEKVNSSLGSF